MVEVNITESKGLGLAMLISTHRHDRSVNLMR